MKLVGVNRIRDEKDARVRARVQPPLFLFPYFFLSFFFGKSQGRVAFFIRSSIETAVSAFTVQIGLPRECNNTQQVRRRDRYAFNGR